METSCPRPPAAAVLRGRGGGGGWEGWRCGRTATPHNAPTTPHPNHTPTPTTPQPHPPTHLVAGSLPTIHLPREMGTLATLTRAKPLAPSARLNAPVWLLALLAVAVAAAPRPADERRREERETVTLMTRAPISARSIKYLGQVGGGRGRRVVVVRRVQVGGGKGRGGGGGVRGVGVRVRAVCLVRGMLRGAAQVGKQGVGRAGLGPASRLPGASPPACLPGSPGRQVGLAVQHLQVSCLLLHHPVQGACGVREGRGEGEGARERGGAGFSRQPGSRWQSLAGAAQRAARSSEAEAGPRPAGARPSPSPPAHLLPPPPPPALAPPR